MMRDIALGLATAISVATMVLTLTDRTTTAAQTAEALAATVKANEARIAAHDEILKKRGRFVSEATYQLNYLCTTAPTCRQLYAPIAVPE